MPDWFQWWMPIAGLAVAAVVAWCTIIDDDHFGL